MIALLFPVLAYFIFLCLPFANIIFDLYVGIILGLYVVLLYKNKHRRKIALIHCAISIVLLFCKLPALWIFTLSGLSIAMTRHSRIQPLCPLPKTRMLIMTCLPLITFLMIKLNLPILLIEISNGLLMGFYVWMKERLNDENRGLVTNLTTCFMLALSFWILKEYQYLWMMWALFSQIIQLFKVKFILCSQK